MESPSPLLRKFRMQLSTACENLPALDLACGAGRNGLELVRCGIATTFADVREEALAGVRRELEAPALRGSGKLASLWQVDLERPGEDPLRDSQFGAVLVFRYLHRPLMASIKRAVCSGGLVIYETFTVDQPRFGRPANPDYLLRPGELTDCFDGWETLHYFEGIEEFDEEGKQRAIAQIVARKPA